MKRLLFVFMIFPIVASAGGRGINDGPASRANLEFVSPCGIGTLVSDQDVCDCIVHACPAKFRDKRTRQFVDVNGNNVSNDFRRARKNCITQARRECGLIVSNEAEANDG